MAVFRLTDVADDEPRDSKAYWDARVAELWDKPYRGLFGEQHDVERMDERNRKVIAHLTPLDSRVLECACGYGRYAPMFARIARYTGIDLSDRLIAEAREKHPELAFHVADMGSFQTDERFDLIFMVSAWSSIEQRSAEIIAHLKTLLAPGGKIAVFEENNYMVIES